MNFEFFMVNLHIFLIIFLKPISSCSSVVKLMFQSILTLESNQFWSNKLDLFYHAQPLSRYLFEWQYISFFCKKELFCPCRNVSCTNVKTFLLLLISSLLLLKPSIINRFLHQDIFHTNRRFLEIFWCTVHHEEKSKIT